MDTSYIYYGYTICVNIGVTWLCCFARKVMCREMPSHFCLKQKSKGASRYINAAADQNIWFAAVSIPLDNILKRTQYCPCCTEWVIFIWFLVSGSCSVSKERPEKAGKKKKKKKTPPKNKSETSTNDCLYHIKCWHTEQYSFAKSVDGIHILENPTHRPGVGLDKTFFSDKRTSCSVQQSKPHTCSDHGSSGCETEVQVATRCFHLAVFLCHRVARTVLAPQTCSDGLQTVLVWRHSWCHLSYGSGLPFQFQRIFFATNVTQVCENGRGDEGRENKSERKKERACSIRDRQRDRARGTQPLKTEDCDDGNFAIITILGIRWENGIPVDTRRNNNVIITSKRHHSVVLTL